MIKTVKVKSNGKINIGLNIVGREGEFHSLDTVVVPINIYDTVVIRSRKDDKVNLATSGAGRDISECDNNAYKAARAFIGEFGTNGGDIRLTKAIPPGSGMGGSSADIVGVLLGMSEIYGVERGEIIRLASTLCSDGEFLLSGSAARLTGRGHIEESFKLKNPLYFTIAVPEEPSVTAEVFAEADGEYSLEDENIGQIIDWLKSGEDNCKREIFNALAAPAMKLHPTIARAYDGILSLCPKHVSMTGSGSAVYGIFDSPEMCFWAKEKLKNLPDTDIIVAESI